MAWLIHSFRESCLQWVIGSFIHCFVVFFIHWFIGSLIHWFLALLIHRFIGSFGHLHGFFHVISSVSQPHFFSRWCASQLHAFAASASQNRLFFPYIYIHTGFKFSKLSPRCGLGTTWYNWCLEIPLKLVLDTLRMKSDERVVMKELLRLVVLQIEAQAQLNRFRNSKRTFALRWQNPNTSYQNLLNHFIQALLLLIVFLMFLILRGCHIIGHQRLHIFFATENSFDLRALFIRMRRRFPSWVLR